MFGSLCGGCVTSQNHAVSAPISQMSLTISSVGGGLGGLGASSASYSAGGAALQFQLQHEGAQHGIRGAVRACAPSATSLSLSSLAAAANSGLSSSPLLGSRYSTRLGLNGTI